MTHRLNLLIVEDDENDAELVRLELERGGFELEWERVDSEAALTQALLKKWDIIISDFAMPGFSGLLAFEIYKKQAADVPFIFVSGALGEERAVQAMRAGAKDYLVKGNLGRLNAVVRRELQEAKNRRARHLSDATALSVQRRLALAIEASDAGVFEIGLTDETPLQYTGAWELILGLTPSALPARTQSLRTWLVKNIHPGDWSVATHDLDDFLAGKRLRYAAEFRLKHNTGRWVDVAAFARVVSQGADGRAEQVVGVLLDVSRRKSLEAQLRQAQKMEAVGQLAGGVAHDFNNLLTAILSFGNFALEAVAPSSPEHDDIEEVLKAAERAQSLTSQLLAFSRRKAVAPRVLSVNVVVTSAEKILRRLLGADIDLHSQLAPDVWNVKVDEDELEQVLLNLAVNARDAMPEGGRLTIETDNVALEEGYGVMHGAQVAPGDYVVIAVSDSGTGMDAATQARIFEPFFTTKEVGRGTGLGLSTCYGIIKQAEGFIWVYSEVGQGTTFRVYLPRVTGPADTVKPQPEPSDLRGSEVIMIVEDNEQVRQLATRVLGGLGYTVLEAANGADALLALETADQRVDLLVTDVVMPILGGKQLVERLRLRHPLLPVLFMSGYAPSAITHQSLLDPGAPMLQKPFTPRILARKVRQVLDGHGAARAPGAS
jgi:hypothetical protein